MNKNSFIIKHEDTKGYAKMTNDKLFYENNKACIKEKYYLCTIII